MHIKYKRYFTQMVELDISFKHYHKDAKDSFIRMQNIFENKRIIKNN